MRFIQDLVQDIIHLLGRIYKCSRHPRIRQRAQCLLFSNVIGFFNSNNNLHAYTFECPINSQMMIAYISEFCRTVTKPTVLVLDQASILTSEVCMDHLPQWHEQRVEIFHLDETGLYENGRRIWLHSVSTPTLTYDVPHEIRRAVQFSKPSSG